MHDGSRLLLSGDGGGREFLVRVVDEGPLLLTAQELSGLAPGAGVDQIWLRLAEADPDAQVEAVDRITDVAAAADPTVRVTGVVTARDQTTRCSTCCCWW